MYMHTYIMPLIHVLCLPSHLSEGLLGRAHPTVITLRPVKEAGPGTIRSWSRGAPETDRQAPRELSLTELDGRAAWWVDRRHR